jgi:tetratricopeptide (TPR) repeat protein
VADTHDVPDLPQEIDGFTDSLLWLVATRATSLVDRLFAAGLAHQHTGVRVRKDGAAPVGPVLADGHHIPTPALIARLIAAGEMAHEHGVPGQDRPVWAMNLPQLLAALDEDGRTRVKRRMTALRTSVARAMQAPPSFKESWIADLAAVCGLTPGEAELLRVSRGYGHEPVDREVLARVITRTLQSPAARRDDPAARRDHLGAAPSARRMLPREPAAFTGREDELRRLLAGTESDARVIAISGLPGIGKTALAVQAAHLLAPRFPDGQFFLGLGGDTPADPADALATLLLMAGTAPSQIPPGLEPKAALWRDRSAGRQILLMLDNASSPAQIEPLLPGTPGSLVLLTSRSRFTTLAGAHAIPLDTLPPEESAELFIRLAARPVLDVAEVAQIVRLCGYLPLAIAALARQLHHHPAWTAASLAADQATALNEDSPQLNAVAAAFDLSYTGLPPTLRRLIRRVGLFPGNEIDSWTAAALDGVDVATARRALNALYDRHLLIETAPGRFRLHDLLRGPAMRLAERDLASERTAAIARLADFYLGAAAAAGRHIPSGWRRGHVAVLAVTAPAAVPGFADSAAAYRWLITERANLDATLQAIAPLFPAHAVAILAATATFLTRGYNGQGLRLSRSALQGASAVEDGVLQGWAILGVAEFEHSTGDLRAALASSGQALSLFHLAGESAGEADATLQAGWLCYLTGDYDGAARQLSHALDLYRSLGDVIGEAHAFAHLGYVSYVNCEYQDAVAKTKLAAGIYAEHDVTDGERGALNQLAFIQREMGDFPAAMANFATALDLSITLRDRHGEATVRTHLAYLQILTGHDDDAACGLKAALETHREVGNKHGEATALNYLGVAQRRRGDAAAAVTSQELSARLYRACGSTLGEANASLELGRSQHQLTGDLAQALATTERALQLFSELNDPVSQAEAHNNIGDFYLTSGNPEAARDSYQQALSLIGDASVPLERARAMEGIARTYPPSARPPEATRQLGLAADSGRLRATRAQGTELAQQAEPELGARD